jgi:hypothetical protein
MLDILKALSETSVPNLLMGLGGILLLLAFVQKVGTHIELPEKRQRVAAVVGTFLLLTGISVTLAPHLTAMRVPAPMLQRAGDQTETARTTPVRAGEAEAPDRVATMANRDQHFETPAEAVVSDHGAEAPPDADAPEPAYGGPPALAPQGGVRSPVRTQDGEVEPNNYVTEANAIQIGTTYAGAIDRDDKDFFAFEVGPGAQSPRLILRRVQGTGGLRVSVFDPHGKESRVGLLNDVLSEKIDVDEAGAYVLLLNAYGDLRYEMVLRSD